MPILELRVHEERLKKRETSNLVPATEAGGKPNGDDPNGRRERSPQGPRVDQMGQEQTVQLHTQRERPRGIMHARDSNIRKQPRRNGLRRIRKPGGPLGQGHDDGCRPKSRREVSGALNAIPRLLGRLRTSIRSGDLSSHSLQEGRTYRQDSSSQRESSTTSGYDDSKTGTARSPARSPTGKQGQRHLQARLDQSRCRGVVDLLERLISSDLLGKVRQTRREAEEIRSQQSQKDPRSHRPVPVETRTRGTESGRLHQPRTIQCGRPSQHAAVLVRTKVPLPEPGTLARRSRRVHPG